jgi:purine nucleoside phosphorylase
MTLAAQTAKTPIIGIIGGSGLYDIEGLEEEFSMFFEKYLQKGLRIE